MITSIDKAIASAVVAGGSAFAAFTTSCSSVFAVFGTHSATAQAGSALLIAVVAGIVTWAIPNKAA